MMGTGGKAHTMLGAIGAPDIITYISAGTTPNPQNPLQHPCLPLFYILQHIVKKVGQHRWRSFTNGDPIIIWPTAAPGPLSGCAVIG